MQEQDSVTRKETALAGAGVWTIPAGRRLVDYKTRNEFEHYCALAEIEEDPEKFAEVRRNIIRLLEGNQALLYREHRTGRIAYPKPSNGAEEQERHAPCINSSIVSSRLFARISSVFRDGSFAPPGKL